MFEERSSTRTFYNAPQSVTAFVSAFMEPLVIVAVYLAAARWYHEPILRPDLILCLLAFAISFPGRNRFKQKLLNAGTDIFSSWFTLLAILMFGAWATRSLHYFNDDVLLAWAIGTPLTLWAAMALGRWVLRQRARDPARRAKAVIIGAGPVGVKVSEALLRLREEGHDVLGWFDDRTEDRLDPNALARLLGGFKDVANFVRANGVKEVYITMPLGSQPRIVELLESLQGTTASLYYVPDVFGISIIQGRLQDMNGVPVVGICETPFTGTNALAKRISDIILASIILVLISPLLLAIAIGVKLSSPGPAIFRQKRNGLDGSEITVYKFRSMRAMDNGPVVAQATKDDPRITRFGAFLRRSSLDELPQFINVLQGHMSIVGPRPHAVAHNELYRELIRAYMVRHKVKPGITGWAQVNGLRGETETVEKMKARVEYDLEYLRNWSIGLDLQIIVRTLRVLVHDPKAY
jgi:putative colanic acid biosysnthesis UDP-glucose lipid carrier transferase